MFFTENLVSNRNGKLAPQRSAKWTLIVSMILHHSHRLLVCLLALCTHTLQCLGRMPVTFLCSPFTEDRLSLARPFRDFNAFYFILIKCKSSLMIWSILNWLLSSTWSIHIIINRECFICYVQKIYKNKFL